MPQDKNSNEPIDGAMEDGQPPAAQPAGESQGFDDAYALAKESGTYGNYQQAASAYATAAELARVFGEEDERLFDSLSRLAYCHYRLGEVVEAESAYREALELMERFHKSRHPDRFASILWAMAVLLSDSKRFEEAESYFNRSMQVSEAWSGPKDRFVADCLWGLSKCLTGAGKLQQAEDAIKRAISIYEGLDENVEDYLCTNYVNLGSLLLQRGKFKDAVICLQKAVKLREKLAGKVDATVMNLEGKLALACMQLKEYGEAQRHLKSSLKTARVLHGNQSPEAARKLVALGNCLACQDKYEAAEKQLTTARTILERNGAQGRAIDATLMSACLFELTGCYQKSKENNKLKAVLQDLVTLYENSPELTRGALYADALIKLGNVYDKQCHFKKARPLFEEALAVRERLFGKEHKLVAEVLMRLGTCLNKMGNALGSEHLRRADTMLADLKKRA